MYVLNLVNVTIASCIKKSSPFTSMPAPFIEVLLLLLRRILKETFSSPLLSLSFFFFFLRRDGSFQPIFIVVAIFTKQKPAPPPQKLTSVLSCSISFINFLLPLLLSYHNIFRLDRLSSYFFLFLLGRFVCSHPLILKPLSFPLFIDASVLV